MNKHAKPTKRNGAHHMGEITKDGNITFKVTLPRELHSRLCSMLETRNLGMDDFVRLAVSNMMRAGRAYEEGDALRFGKYYGEKIETVIRADPGYIDWAFNNLEGFKLSEPLLELLGEVKDPI